MSFLNIYFSIIIFKVNDYDDNIIIRNVFCLLLLYFSSAVCVSVNYNVV